MTKPYPTIRQVPLESGGRPVFELLEDFEFTMPLGTRGEFRFRKPKGVLIDFGSVPRILWPIVNPLDMHLSVSFFVHDDLYLEDSKCPRVQADSMQRIVAAYYNATWAEQMRVYTALRLFGWMCYPSKGIADRRPQVVAAIRSGPNEE